MYQNKNILNGLVFLVCLLFNPTTVAMSCVEAKTYLPKPSPKEQKLAQQLYHFERRNDMPYRSEADIALLLAKAQHIAFLAEGCNIPIDEIGPNEYFELTGKIFN